MQKVNFAYVLRYIYLYKTLRYRLARAFFCTITCVIEMIWIFWFVYNILGVGSLERFVLAGINRNVVNLEKI